MTEAPLLISDSENQEGIRCPSSTSSEDTDFETCHVDKSMKTNFSASLLSNVVGTGESGNDSDSSENNQVFDEQKVLCNNISDFQQNETEKSNTIEEPSKDSVFWVNAVSSPIESNTELPMFSVSSIKYDKNALSFLNSTDISYDSGRKLFQGSHVCVRDAVGMIEQFCSHYKLSDEGAISVHAIIKALLPLGNNFPKASSYIKSVKTNFTEQVRVLEKNSESTLCVLRFCSQLNDIVRKYLDVILCYSLDKVKKPSEDFNLSFSPRVEVSVNQSIAINISLFADGVNIKKSTFKKELWPIWLQTNDLPPKLRMARKNVVLAGLYVGSKHPNWHRVVPFLRSEILSPIKLDGDRTHSISVNFEIKVIVSDLCANSHLLNMFQFNGFFGCHYCTVEGKTIGKSHAYYPFQQEGNIRVPYVNDVYVAMAENMRAQNIKNIVGVKGRSAFAGLVRGLPLTAPIDYMHCVLLGVFPEVLKLCIRSLRPTDKQTINRILSQLTCPRELIAFSRKISSLGEIGQFKANEHFNWLFYISPLVFRGRLPRRVFSHLSCLIFGVRLLIESSDEAKVRVAEQLLTQFCSEIVSPHDGNDRVETINVHSPRHLPDQVRRFGPLHCYSAMSFEAANRTLGEVFSGSNSECEIICRRILQKHKLSDTEILDKELCKTFNKIKGLPNEDTSFFSNEMMETVPVKEVRLHYPNAVFFNRQKVKETYFDSTAFKRSKFCNCFNSFEEDERMLFGKV